MKDKNIPPAQAITYVIGNALTALELLQELENEWQEGIKNGKEGAKIRCHQSIIRDAIAVYIASLFDKTKVVHSLEKTCAKEEWFKKLKENHFIEECVAHRNNRVCHQSKMYGSVVSVDTIISSSVELKSLLEELQIITCFLPNKVHERISCYTIRAGHTQ